jgi:hypothetical protein
MSWQKKTVGSDTRQDFHIPDTESEGMVSAFNGPYARGFAERGEGIEGDASVDALHAQDFTLGIQNKAGPQVTSLVQQKYIRSFGDNGSPWGQRKFTRQKMGEFFHAEGKSQSFPGQGFKGAGFLLFTRFGFAYLNKARSCQHFKKWGSHGGESCQAEALAF